MTNLTPRAFITMPAWPLHTISHLLPEHGVWLAGGAVRDLLLRRVPHDWDLVLVGSGLEVARSVANALRGAYYALDRERGTGRAIVNHPASGEPVTLDFAAMRGRTIEQDLRARDFTVNAMALTLDGCLIDPTGGQADLATAKLRMVSPTCFMDDPVRLVRAIRISMQLDLAVEFVTATHLREEAELVLDCAPERVRAELVTLLSLPRAPEGVRRLDEFGLFSRVLPEAVPAVGTLNAIEQFERTLGPEDGAWSEEPQAPPEMSSAVWQAWEDHLQPYLAAHTGGETTRADLLRWATLYAGGPEAAGRAARGLDALRFSKSENEFVRLILIGQDAFRTLLATGIPEACCAWLASGSGQARYRGALRAGLIAPLKDADARRAVYRYFQSTGDAGIAAALLFVARAVADGGPSRDAEAWSTDLCAAVMLAEAYFLHREDIVEPRLLLSGDGVMALGVPHGPRVGQALSALREAQAAGEVDTPEGARELVHELAVDECTEGTGEA